MGDARPVGKWASKATGPGLGVNCAWMLKVGRGWIGLVARGLGLDLGFPSTGSGSSTLHRHTHRRPLFSLEYLLTLTFFTLCLLIFFILYPYLIIFFTLCSLNFYFFLPPASTSLHLLLLLSFSFFIDTYSLLCS